MQDVIIKMPQDPSGGSVTVEALRVILAQAVAALEVVVGLQGRVPRGLGEEYAELVGKVEKIFGRFV